MPLPDAAGTWQRRPCTAHAGVRQATQALLTAAGFFLAAFFAGFWCGAAAQQDGGRKIQHVGMNCSTHAWLRVHVSCTAIR